MNLKITNVKIREFRKIKNYETNLEDTNIIYGKNGSGKTSIIDAISWCLFGKNFEDSTFETNKFENNGSLKEQNTMVTLSLTIDGLPTEIVREYKNSRTSILVDGVPKKVSEYNDYIEKTIMCVDNFKIFVNPAHFNSNLHWKEKRKMLMDYFDSPSNEEIVGECDFKPNSTFFMKELRVKTPEDIKLKYDNLLKNLEKELNKHNAQIEYLEDELSEYEDKDQINLVKYENGKKILSKKLEDVAEEMENQGKLISKREVLKSKLENSTYTEYNPEYTNREIRLETLVEKHADTSSEYGAAKNVVIKTKCPTCKQDIPEDRILAIKKKQREKINEILKKGKKLQADIKEAKKLLKETPKKREVKNLTDKEVKEIEKELKSIIINDDTYKRFVKLNSELANIENEIKNAKEKKTKEKNLKTFIKKQKETATNIEKYENTVDDSEKFIELRTKNIVSKVNKSFKNIKIKLFSELKNGEIRETFDITRSGVPYDELNSTGKLMAGLELLNYLKKSMKTDTPIIIDNFERYPSIPIDELGDSQIIVVVAEEGKADKLGDFKVLNKKEYEGVK